MTKPQRTRLQSYAWLLLNTLCWGGALVIVKPAFDYTTPNLLMFYRFSIAGILMLPLILISLRKRELRKKLSIILGIEMIGTVLYLALLYEGLARSSAIEASLLASTLPIFIIATGVIFLHEKLTHREWIGFTISLVGVLLLTMLPIINGEAKLHELSLAGNGLILLSNMICAVYLILAKKYYKGIPKLFTASISFLIGSIAFGVLSLRQLSWSISSMIATIQADWQNLIVVVIVLYMAILGSIVGLTAYIKGQDGIEASEASLFYYLQPLIYLPMGVILLGESISWLQIIGLVLIIIGVIYSEQPFAKHRK